MRSLNEFYGAIGVSLMGVIKTFFFQKNEWTGNGWTEFSFVEKLGKKNQIASERINYVENHKEH